jgi:hypothetical protein
MRNAEGGTIDSRRDAVRCGLVAEFERRSGALFGARLAMTADPLSGLSERTDQFVLSATQYQKPSRSRPWRDRLEPVGFVRDQAGRGVLQRHRRATRF